MDPAGGVSSERMAEVGETITPSITAISVVVARIIPKRVRKLRSFDERSDPIATPMASRREAEPCTVSLRRSGSAFSSVSVRNPVPYDFIRPEPWRFTGDEANVTAVFGSNQLNIRVGCD